MNRHFVAMALGVFVFAVPAFAEPLPCDKLASQVRVAMKTAIVGDASQKRIAELYKRGLGECNGELDAAADRDLQAALRLLRK